MPKVIKVENLSKLYNLGTIGTGTMSRDLERYWARLRGREDPFMIVGETNDRTTKTESGVVWSLKDINFEIEQGDAVGIIGRNGAGKSTLLKILSRITSPTTGSIKTKGRIASLLEVGTGFHPELTGTENIYLNGAVLGMRKAEIKRKFDEIVEFSGVERYIDTPVKRYSSGMYVRLAFAVAAHLESEILIVDEVLAVGDAEFQKKCLGKMGEVSRGEGRTVLFVSHNMGAVSQLCSTLILLENGKIEFKGNVNDGYNIYQKHAANDFQREYVSLINDHIANQPAHISSINLDNSQFNDLATNEPLLFRIGIKSNKEIANHRIGVKINTIDGKPIGLLFSEPIVSMLSNTELEVTLQVKNHNLAKGVYVVDFSLGVGNEEEAISELHVIQGAITFGISKKNMVSETKISNWNKLNWGDNNYCDVVVYSTIKSY